MKKTLALSALIAVASIGWGQSVFEHFNDIGGPTSNGQLFGANLEAQGWYLQNNSSGTGLTDWFQGNTAVFGPHATSGYIAANFNNASGLGTISNWLLTPMMTMNNGDVLSFWTRTITSPAFPDRLQVRLSTAGSSTNVGTQPTDVGDFTNLLLDINPAYTLAIYPTSWTQFTVTVTGLSNPAPGRFAFRYFVENGGPSGANSDYIGIDTVAWGPLVPEPGTMVALGAGTALLLRRRIRRS